MNYLDHIIRVTSRIEIVLEYILTQRFDNNTLLEILSLFEAYKSYYRLKKFYLQQKQVLISEDNKAVEAEINQQEKVKEINELFEDDGVDFNHIGTMQTNSIRSNTSNESLSQSMQQDSELYKKKVKNLLDSIKNRKFKANVFNQEYVETLQRSKKKIQLLSTLPIPQEMFQKSAENDTESIKILIGELIYIFRPLVYSLLLRYHGFQSYKPYLISLALDLLRLILQRKILYYSKSEKEEFRDRNNYILYSYLLRNPFYQLVLRQKVLDPVLDRVCKQFIKNTIIQMLELRCSFSLLM